MLWNSPAATANSSEKLTITPHYLTLPSFHFRFKNSRSQLHRWTSFRFLRIKSDGQKTIQSHVKVNNNLLSALSLSLSPLTTMHSRASQNRLSTPSRISVLLLAMFATMAAVYVAGRLGFFFLLFFFNLRILFTLWIVIYW